MKIRTNQEGISPLIIILLLLLLAVAGFVGWTIYKSNKDSNQSKSSSTSKTETTTKSTPKRTEPTYVKPAGETYRVALPATWVSGICADNPDILFLAPTADKLGKCQSGYFGTVALSKNTGNIGHNEEYYTSDNAYDDVTYAATTIDGITGYKVTYTVATENELGVPEVGTKIVQYVLYDGANSFTISYSRTAADKDLTATVQTLAESFDKL